MTTTHPKAKLTELEPHFARITGMPVVGKDNVLLGVVSKKDLRATFDHTTTVAVRAGLLPLPGAAVAAVRLVGRRGSL